MGDFVAICPGFGSPRCGTGRIKKPGISRFAATAEVRGKESLGGLVELEAIFRFYESVSFVRKYDVFAGNALFPKGFNHAIRLLLRNTDIVRSLRD